MREAHSANGIVNQTYVYNYDSCGNRASNVASGTENYSYTYSYDKNNRLTYLAYQPVGQSYGDLEAYVYDKNGNPTAKVWGKSSEETRQSNTYVYDGFNLLRVINCADGSTVNYSYNPNGLRLLKSVNGSTTYHFWNGQQLMLDIGSDCAANLYVKM